jgi:4-hydroxythreonine-4-phosphate dehydrogenase
MKSRFKKIAITTGDVSGVGLEVASKALCELSPSLKKNKALFFLFRHQLQSKMQPALFAALDKKWSRVVVPSLEDALSFIAGQPRLADNTLIDIAHDSNSEADWVLEAAQACVSKKLDSLVTGPLSKKLTIKLPAKPVGHTGIFRNLFPKSILHMGFVGRDFSVLLATDHIPLASVESRLLAGDFKKALRSAKLFQNMLGSTRKIGVLGFNPHAGETGILGRTENRMFKRLPKEFEGPLVPDAAFLKKNWKAYSLFLCMYHDQGLIPFKMHHGQDSGVHVTIGLPFVRTSVDHGTAEDIFNKNVANHASMLEAIELNLRFLGVKHV